MKTIDTAIKEFCSDWTIDEDGCFINPCAELYIVRHGNEECGDFGEYECTTVKNYLDDEIISSSDVENITADFGPFEDASELEDIVRDIING